MNTAENLYDFRDELSNKNEENKLFIAIGGRSFKMVIAKPFTSFSPIGYVINTNPKHFWSNVKSIHFNQCDELVESVMKKYISEKEKAKRRTAWAKAVSSSYFEGVSPTVTMNLIANRFINGEIDIKDAVNQMMQHLNSTEMA